MIGLTNPACDADRDLSKPRAQRRRALLLVRLARVDDLPLALDVLLVALGSPQGELPRQQVVAGVAISDLYSLAALAQIVDVLSQNNVHGCLLVGCVRDQRELARTHECRPELPLVHRTRARDAPRQNLGALGNERHQQLHVLVVDVVDLVRAELADLSTPEHRTALTAFLCRPSRRTAPAAPASKTSSSVHRSISGKPSNRSSRSSSLSPRCPSPG